MNGLHGTILTENGTLNGLHGTIGTENGMRNSLHGTIGTVNGTLNGLRGTILWCCSTLQSLYLWYPYVEAFILRQNKFLLYNIPLVYLCGDL